MKRTTLIVKSKPIGLITSQVESILNNNQNAFISPIINKTPLFTGDFMYVREPTIVLNKDNYNELISNNSCLDNIATIIKDELIYIYTDISLDKLNLTNITNIKQLSSKQMSKEITRVFIKLNTTSCFNVLSFTDDMLSNLGFCTNNQLRELWKNITTDLLSSTSNELTRKRLELEFSFDTNPIVNYVTFERIEESNDIDDVTLKD